MEANAKEVKPDHLGQHNNIEGQNCFAKNGNAVDMVPNQHTDSQPYHNDPATVEVAETDWQVE